MHMKLLITFSALSLILFASCNDFDRRTKFKTSYTNRVTFTKSGAPSQILIESDTLTQDLMKVVNDHGASSGSIEAVWMSGLSLEIDRKKSPEFANFDFLKEVKIFLRPKGKKEIMVGRIEHVPEGEIEFFETRVLQTEMDFLDILKTNEFTYRLEFTTDKDFDSGTVIKIIALYSVDTKRLGV